MRQQIPDLTALERREKHRLFLRDTAAMGALAALVLVLSFTTYALFHSFSAHRRMLELRWRDRGEASMAKGDPQAAINDLHSALAFSPDDRSLEIELATALAEAGRTREAQTYFNTLLEGEPGSGIINLELARLTARQGNTQAAIDHYQAAIDGTWNGDGYVRRQAIRLELTQMLIADDLLPEARNQLLITAGNAPEDHGLQLQVGGLLLKAGDPSDAMDVYKKAARARPTRLDGLEGEAQAAAGQGRYLQAHSFLTAAMGESGFKTQPEPVRAAVHQALDEADGILALYPGDQLSPWVRAGRIAHNAQLAQARLAACPATPAAAAPTTKQQQQILSGLAAHLQQLNPLKHLGANPAVPTSPAPPAPPAPSDQLATLSARWTAVPTGQALVDGIATDPSIAQNTLNLTYATEHATAQACGAPTGANALLLKIADAPDQVEAQQ